MGSYSTHMSKHSIFATQWWGNYTLIKQLIGWVLLSSSLKQTAQTKHRPILCANLCQTMSTSRPILMNPLKMKECNHSISWLAHQFVISPSVKWFGKNCIVYQLIKQLLQSVVNRNPWDIFLFSVSIMDCSVLKFQQSQKCSCIMTLFFIQCDYISQRMLNPCWKTPWRTRRHCADSVWTWSGVTFPGRRVEQIRGRIHTEHRWLLSSPPLLPQKWTTT